MRESPLVSIVTPVYNLADYVQETVRSVLTQDYPRIEYIVMDGGSTDGTIEILQTYSGRLKLVSQPDQGTAGAVNQGFLLSRGDIFAFLNADDTYEPGAVRAAVEHLTAHPEAGGVYGEAQWIAADGSPLGPYPTRDFDAELLRRECFICQPACFLRRQVFERAGMLDARLRYAFDYDLWIRVARFARLERLDRLIANSRMRRDNKTLGQRGPVLLENMRVLKRHYGYVPCAWVYAYASFLLDRRDQFFEPMTPSTLKWLFSFPLGWRWNARHPWHFVREWASWATLAAARRQWARFRGAL